MRLKYEPAPEPLHISDPRLLVAAQTNCPDHRETASVGWTDYSQVDTLGPWYESSSSLLLSSLELSDTRLYEP